MWFIINWVKQKPRYHSLVLSKNGDTEGEAGFLFEGNISVCIVDLSGLNNPGEEVVLKGSALGFHMISNALIYLSQRLSEFWMIMVLDWIIGSGLRNIYLCKSRAIYTHLFPF